LKIEVNMVKKSSKSKEKLRGLGGWLILPIIGLCGSLIVFLYDFSLTFETSFDYLSLWDLALIVLIIICLIAIFNKKEYAPKLMISFYIALILNGLLAAILLEDYTSLVQSSIASLIWISYFNVSERVKNTLVN